MTKGDTEFSLDWPAFYKAVEDDAYELLSTDKFLYIHRGRSLRDDTTDERIRQSEGRKEDRRDTLLIPILIFAMNTKGANGTMHVR